MIAGLIIGSRAWRTVGWARVLAAAVLVVGTELLAGAAAAALLGYRKGAAK